MKVLLIGASGMIGSHILNEAVSRGHEIVAASRNPDKISANDNVSAVKLDANNEDEIAKHAENVDTIISAVSPRTTGEPITEAAAIASALIKAAGKTGKRLIVVGGAGSLKTPDGGSVLDNLPDFIVPEATSMKNVYLALQTSDIEWTFFAPPPLIQAGDKTEQYRLGGDTVLTAPEGPGNISAGDYAHALVNELEKPAHSKQIFTIAY